MKSNKVTSLTKVRALRDIRDKFDELAILTGKEYNVVDMKQGQYPIVLNEFGARFSLYNNVHGLPDEYEVVDKRDEVV